MLSKKKKTKSTRNAVKRIPFALQQRLAFIEESLFWTGEVSRGHLEQHFRISNQRAALDFAFYRKEIPTNIEYDGSAKRYVPTVNFIPQFYQPSNSGLRMWAPVEEVPTLERSCEPSKLRVLVQAIRRKQRCKIFYRSLNSDSAKWRETSPHIFVFDGQRYHVRVYDHTTEKWCDLVVGRIEKVEASKTGAQSAEEDTEWNRRIVVAAEPSKHLGAIARKALANDYSTKRGVLKIATREALKYYIEVLLGVKSLGSQRWQLL